MKGNARKLVPPARNHDFPTIVGAIVAAILIVCVFVAHTAQSANATITADTSMTRDVPATLPASGVTVDNRFILHPLTQVQQSEVKITAQQAITIGRTYANAQPFAETTLLTSFTSIDSVPPPGATERSHVIQNVIAWIVTFTSNDPQNVIIGKKPAPDQTPAIYAPRHFNVVINAQTGAFVLGFFTP
jgi:hypothetical protein